MHRGIASYGCVVKASKTAASFDLTDVFAEMNLAASANANAPEPTEPVAPPPASARIAWCGLLIDARTCEVYADNERYWGTGRLRDSISISFQPTLRIALKRNVRAFVRPKCYAVLLDASVNSLSAIALNVFQLALVAAAKYVCVTNEWRARNKHLRSASVEWMPMSIFASAIATGVRYLLRLIRHRSNRVTKVAPIGESAGAGAAALVMLAAHSTVFLAREGTSSATTAPSLITFAPPQSEATSIQSSCPLTDDEILWLSIKAFAIMFSRASDVYRPIIRRCMAFARRHATVRSEVRDATDLSRSAFIERVDLR